MRLPGQTRFREPAMAPVQPGHDLEALCGRDDVDGAVAVQIACDDVAERAWRSQPGDCAARERQPECLAVRSADNRDLVRAAVTVEIGEEPIVSGGRAVLGKPQGGGKRDGLPQATGGHVQDPM